MLLGWSVGPPPRDWRQLDQPTIETADGWSVGPSPIGWWRPDQPTIGSPVIQVAFPVLLPCLADCNLKITNSRFRPGAPGPRAEVVPRTSRPLPAPSGRSCPEEQVARGPSGECWGPSPGSSGGRGSRLRGGSAATGREPQARPGKPLRGEMEGTAEVPPRAGPECARPRIRDEGNRLGWPPIAPSLEKTNP